MARLILILTLMMTQPVSGTDATICLCIGTDGTLGIHAGCDSCPPCAARGKTSNHTCANEFTEEGASSCPCTAHRPSRQCPSLAGGQVVKKSCKCVHIPIFVSSDQPSGVARFSAKTDNMQFFTPAALPPFSGVTCRTISSLPPDRCCTFTVPAFSLAIVATVVISC